MASTLRQRLIHDIAELQSKPYPNIELHVQDDDITKACLILTVVDGYGPMHLTVNFPSDYPLSPPSIQMDSNIKHPNIFGTYICASILNTTEGYTSAYTLKGIAIQLLSFFSSDKIEQVGGGFSVGLDAYRSRSGQQYLGRQHVCQNCQFGVANASTTRAGGQLYSESLRMHWHRLSPEVPFPQGWDELFPKISRTSGEPQPASPSMVEVEGSREGSRESPFKIQKSKIPDEILLMICDYLETEDLMVFAEAWNRIGVVMTKFDVIRTRELQCFCLKKDYTVSNIKLGVGVSISQTGRLGTFESEFDLLSQEGFGTHGIRRSVQGVPFQRWLPLPISYGHWRKVQGDVLTSLSSLAVSARLGNAQPVKVIYHFMNDVVVKLNQQASKTSSQSPYYPYEETAQSSLTHASEKAIESYFHLFHLLLCMATSDPSIIRSANTTLNNFIEGKTSKDACPNLGHLLVAALISDVEMTAEVIKSIINETIVRNVVWMLDSRGANMPELSYLEPDPVSSYRLKHTFEASKTSYRLLMFLNIFRKAAIGSPRKPLPVILREAFERHGAPPRGSAKELADSIKHIHTIDSFPSFLDCMGIAKPTGESFTSFLRKTVQTSAEKGYSRMALRQDRALYLRQRKEPGVGIEPGLTPAVTNLGKLSFFPDRGGSAHGGGQGGGRGGGGDGRGRRGGRGRGGY
ncbi:hypothetical protein LSUE1_G000100 [Lachnellula suecica]|uniref:UBC core domain-containing protein n=1 Tax=Lachnellula suecica TaxID=602035 RepID=A0A8T9CK54_9HELO|nr:hypothetical protein LSUE1_G000100 [Lachnellula suecica]